MISRILATKREEVDRLASSRPGPRTRPVVPLVCDGPANIIAELKRKSPSAGFIAEIGRDRVAAYSRHAKAVSVLTDRTYFGGSLEFLAEVAYRPTCPSSARTSLSPRQIDFAYAAGADLVLLIARILSREALDSLMRHASSLASPASSSYMTSRPEESQGPRHADPGGQRAGPEHPGDRPRRRGAASGARSGACASGGERHTV
jgi:hypothetical protein